VQFDAPRDRLAQTVVEVRAAMAAANRDYPDQYLIEAEAAAQRNAQVEADRQARLDADKAVIDDAMRRPLDEPQGGLIDRHREQSPLLIVNQAACRPAPRQGYRAYLDGRRCYVWSIDAVI
jgi:hypothetical protein